MRLGEWCRSEIQMRAFSTEKRLPARTSYWHVRALLATALVSIVISHVIAKSHSAIEICFLVSWMVLIGLAVECALTTAHTTEIRIRKFTCFAMASTFFVVCVAAICELRHSDVDFFESGEWAPMPPEVLSIPAQGLCTVVALAAVWGLVHLTSVIESPEEFV